MINVVLSFQVEFFSLNLHLFSEHKLMSLWLVLLWFVIGDPNFMGAGSFQKSGGPHGDQNFQSLITPDLPVHTTQRENHSHKDLGSTGIKQKLSRETEPTAEKSLEPNSGNRANSRFHSHTRRKRAKLRVLSFLRYPAHIVL